MKLAQTIVEKLLQASSKIHVPTIRAVDRDDGFVDVFAGRSTWLCALPQGRTDLVERIRLAAGIAQGVHAGRYRDARGLIETISNILQEQATASSVA